MPIAMIVDPLSEPVPDHSSLKVSQPENKTRRTLSEILQAQFEALQRYHRAVLDSDDPEAIHKMRVTTRRVQASLDLLASQINVSPIKKRLRRWRQELSRARNYDVFLSLLEKEAASLNVDCQLSFDVMRDVLQQHRVTTLGKVRADLMDKSVRKLAARLGIHLPPGSSVSINDFTNDGTSAEASSLLPVKKPALKIDEAQLASYMADGLEQRVAEFVALAAQTHSTTEAEELHELRIAAKRIRYLFEIISEMGYGNPAQALAWLRTLQDRIGDWHDLESLELEIVEIIARRNYLKAHLFESSQMLQAAAHIQRKKERLGAKVFPVEVPEILLETSQRLAMTLRQWDATDQPLPFETISGSDGDLETLPPVSSQEA